MIRDVKANPLIPRLLLAALLVVAVLTAFSGWVRFVLVPVALGMTYLGWRREMREKQDPS